MKEMNSLTHSCMHSLASFAIFALSGNDVFMMRATGAKLAMNCSDSCRRSLCDARRWRLRTGLAADEHDDVEGERQWTRDIGRGRKANLMCKVLCECRLVTDECLHVLRVVTARREVAERRGNGYDGEVTKNSVGVSQANAGVEIEMGIGSGRGSKTHERRWRNKELCAHTVCNGQISILLLDVGLIHGHAVLVGQAVVGRRIGACRRLCDASFGRRF